MRIKTDFEMKYLSTKDAAKQWAVKPRTVAKNCAKGLIPGAFKQRNKWKIPVNSIKPLKEKEIKMLLLSLIKVHNHISIGYKQSEFLSDKNKSVLEKAMPFLSHFSYISFVDKKKTLDGTLLTDKAYELISTGIKVDVGNLGIWLSIGVNVLKLKQTM